MKVGITIDLRFSMFSSGNPNACISLTELFQAMGHDIVYLIQNEDRDWWDDVITLKDKSPPRIVISKVLALDLVIELSFFLSPLDRKRIGADCIWYCRKPPLFTDIEAAVYFCKPEGRNLDGIQAIWVSDIYTNSDDVEYLQSLYPSIPVTIVPWMWTPQIVESHRSNLKSPVWLQIHSTLEKDKPWSLHITENNSSNSTSCIIPLVTLRISNITNRLSSLSVHNMERLQSNDFFKENILAHTKINDISAALVGRQRIIDWTHDPNSIILSHSRFIPLKMANLEAAWVGIPIIHNNSILRDLGYGLEKLYYSNNSISEASAALTTAISNTESVPYLISENDILELRKRIIARFHPLSRIHEWEYILKNRLNPISSINPIPIVKKEPNVFTVLFTDMWDQFNESYNMFTLALQNAIPYKVNGYSITTLEHREPDIIIFGPFGNTWKELPKHWPKIHYTGENTDPILDESVKLNMGYKPTSNSYLRLPLWMLEIDWFNADLTLLRNPLVVPIDSCLQVISKVSYDKRKKFCAFIVTNPSNPIRNEAFLKLNSYKPVDSAGRLFNTTGDAIFAGLGGGGGELMKIEFLKDYRFCIVYENSSSPGYTTEKLLHAKVAGCVPIYWGDPNTDFDQKGFLNAMNTDIIDLVKDVETNPLKWSEITSIPALSLEMRDQVRSTLSDMVKRFLQIANRPELLPSVPDLLGASRSPIKPTSISLFVTGTTLRFWPSLLIWLDSLKTHRQSISNFQTRVYVGSDVSDTLIEKTKESYKEFAEFIRFPIETPSNFSDFWSPQHFAWRLWIYNQVVNDPTITGKLVFYMDTASVMIRWPTEWIEHTLQSGVSCLNDSSQKNNQWCHKIFCDTLQVSENELNENQIIAGLMLFIAGHPSAVSLFTKAYEFAQIREVIVGEKWEGIRNGLPFGHRHDQSILSILSSRLKIPRFPLNKVYCDTSARNTFYGGQSIYVHRGNYKKNIPILDGIDEAFVINLDRREDRRKAFIEFHPDLKGIVRRLPAFDGKNLELTPSLASLFRVNDFFWKKAVMGCALSHLKLWAMLISEPSEIQSYFILEDDARLQTGWRDAWLQAYPSLPEDWDCVYLGGILPPNKEGYPSVVERLAPGLARIKLNQIFGQPIPNRYFHFCAYSYVISRSGAEKILESIHKRNGYWTSADHMICSPVDTMNLYMLDPLVAKASQDDDPIYQKAEFNNFSRIDSFDSDLWNNDERFSKESVEFYLEANSPIDIQKVYSELLTIKKTKYIALDISNIYDKGLYEYQWLQELFQTTFTIDLVSADTTLDSNTNYIIFISKPKWTEQLEWLESLRRSIKFKLVHLSDEFKTDPIHMYDWPEVTSVLRFYTRSNLNSKVTILPLGYHRKNSANSPKSFIWSFAGTDWLNRSNDIKPLEAIKPNIVKWFPDWNDPSQLNESEYMLLMASSHCVACPRGQNVETFRFYEALECGSIPVFIDSNETTEWLFSIFKEFGEIPFMRIKDWTHAAELMQGFIDNPKEMERYRTSILEMWSKYKIFLKDKIKGIP